MMTEIKPVITDDGSNTIYHPEIDEHYHSTFGAIQESRHVFIESGLNHVANKLKQINILEVGFGTGLNALLALQWSEKHRIRVSYTTIEPYPISLKLAAKLNYPDILKIEKELFLKLHQKSQLEIDISPYFTILKMYRPLQECELEKRFFDVVFFDAFSPEAQPEMWTTEVFQQIADATKQIGILTTYSSKGIVKRALAESGFLVKKLPGPPGKREILRAIKE